MIESGDGWFVADPEGRAIGPLTRPQLLEMREQGKIGDQHLVWTLRQAEWVPLRRALGMGGSAADAPPKPPTSRPGVAKSSNKPAAKTARARDNQKRDGSQANEVPAHRKGPAWSDLSTHKAEAMAATESLLKADQRKALTAQSQERAGEALRRFFARQIDLALLGGISWALVSIIGIRTGVWLLSTPEQEMQQSVIAALIVLLVLALPLEALLLGLSGYTPGKWLLGLRVVNGRGAAPGISTALQRATRVALAGQALLIPPFVLFTYAVAFGKLSNSGLTSWDQTLGLKVQRTPLSSNQWWLALGALVFAWVMVMDGVWMRIAYELAGY
ncbi:MAG: RDD family protein [Lysobacterales bacterium]